MIKMTKSEVEKAKDNLVEASLNFADAVSSNRIDMGDAEEAFWDAVEGYQKEATGYTGLDETSFEETKKK